MITNTPIKTKWFCAKCLIYPQLKTIINDITGHISYLVECPKCLCHTNFYETEDEAKAAWDDKKIPRTYIIDNIIEDKNKSMKTDSKKSWDKVRDVLEIAYCTILFGIVLYGGCYALPREFIKATREAREARREAQRTIAERSEEQIMSLSRQYKGKDFHKVILEGHEYWYIENFKNNVGFCHSESCPCKTNKVEAVQ